MEFLADPNSTFGDSNDQYKLYLFDIQMFTVIEMASAQTITYGSLVVGKETSGVEDTLRALYF